MNFRVQAIADASSVAEQQKPDLEKLAFLLQKTNALSRAICKVFKAYHKDYFELNKDYVLNLLNDLSEQITQCSKGFCENSFIIDSNSPSMVFKAVSIANSFHLLSGLLHLKQKWVNIHLTSILKLWRNFFSECKLSLPTGGK